MDILLTSAGRRSYLVRYFKEALAGKGKVYAANSEWSTVLEVADKAVFSPLIFDERYTEFLMNYCKNHHIKLLISLFDMDLPVLAGSKRNSRKKESKIVVSDSEVTKYAMRNEK